MFNLHDFIFDNLVNGYKNDSFTKEQVVIFASNYMLKGIFTEKDLENINDILLQIEEANGAVTQEETTEEVVEEAESIAE